MIDIHLHLLPGVDDGAQSLEQALAVVNRLMDQQAYTQAVTDLFWASACVMLLLIGLVWLAERPSRPPGPAG